MFYLRHQSQEYARCFNVERNALNGQCSITLGALFVHSFDASCDLGNGKPIQENVARKDLLPRILHLGCEDLSHCCFSSQLAGMYPPFTKGTAAPQQRD